MAGRRPPRRPTSLNVTLHLPDVESIYEAPSVAPSSPAYHSYSYTSGLEYIADRLYADRRLKAVDATFLVPGDQLSSTTEQAIREAVERYASAQIEKTSLMRRAAVSRGRRALLLGIVALVVLFTAASVVIGLGDDNPVVDTIAMGLEIGAWVALWIPIERLTWEAWGHRNDRKLYERVRDMQYVVVADSDHR
jgi:hypothetical protein